MVMGGKEEGLEEDWGGADTCVRVHAPSSTHTHTHARTYMHMDSVARRPWPSTHLHRVRHVDGHVVGGVDEVPHDALELENRVEDVRRTAAAAAAAGLPTLPQHCGVERTTAICSAVQQWQGAGELSGEQPLQLLVGQ